MTLGRLATCGEKSAKHAFSRVLRIWGQALQNISIPELPHTEVPMGSLQRVAYSLIIFSIVVIFLYIGREILVPLALASLLSFVLWPVIKLLRRARVGRVTSVIAAVVLTIAGIVGLGSIMAMQVSDLAEELPRYESNLREKVKAFKGASTPSGAMGKAADAIQGLQDELEKSDSAKTTDPAVAPNLSAATAPDVLRTTPPLSGTQARPVIVEVHEPKSTVLQTYQDVIGPLLSPVTTMALVILFLGFILMQREDLRDRLLRLAGGGDLQRSTVAMNDAAERLSAYFLIQLGLNTGFGIVIGVGLALIGIPSPVLWGILAALMRFVPYVGSPIAAFFPIALAAAIDSSWTLVAETAALYLISEPIAGQVLEPMLYGKNTGLSPVAVVVSALFWTLMWGAVGLLLATPLTVCLVVLGKHVPALSFLNLVLGDEPALAPEERLYQRLLTGDADESAAVAEEQLEQTGLTNYYSNVAMKALTMAHVDAVRGRLNRESQNEMLLTIAEMSSDLEDYDLQPVVTTPVEKGKSTSEKTLQRAGTIEAGETTTGVQVKMEKPSVETGSPIICIPTRSALDEAAAILEVKVLQKHGADARLIDRAEVASLTADMFPAHAIVGLSYFGTSSPLHVRTIARRLKRVAPHVKIVAGFWMLGENRGKISEWQKYVGADFSTSSLAEAIEFCRTASLKKPVIIQEDTGRFANAS